MVENIYILANKYLLASDYDELINMVNTNPIITIKNERINNEKEIQ